MNCMAEAVAREAASTALETINDDDDDDDDDALTSTAKEGEGEGVEVSTVSQEHVVQGPYRNPLYVTLIGL